MVVGPLAFARAVFVVLADVVLAPLDYFGFVPHLDHDDLVHLRGLAQLEMSRPKPSTTPTI